MNQICLDCGDDYEYTPGHSLGASSTRCAKCRKRDTKRQKHVNLLMIAGNGTVQCRMCRYNKCTSALLLKDAVALLSGDSSMTPETKARRQYILCLNCNEEVASSKVEVKVTNSKSYPVEVSFFIKEVTIVRKQITSAVNYTPDYHEPEIVSEDHGREATRVSPKTKGLIGEQAIEVQAL